MSRENGTPILQVLHQWKRFGPVVANRDVSFDLARGEIHYLLGENGAGKSTLAKCLYGAYKPDSGTLLVDGQEVVLDSPRDAIRVGIGMVHQHFVLVPPASVIENIIVGTDSAGALLRVRQAEGRIKALCRDYGIDLDLGARVSDLPVGKQQWVEILKALFSGAQILILDEPTAVLTPQEAEGLFGALRQMASQGRTVAVITHKLNEVMATRARVTVMRKGEVVATVMTTDVTASDLAQMMVGRGVSFHVKKEKQQPGPVVLELRALQGLKEHRTAGSQEFSLTVRSGEIVGLAGVSGNGQDELFDLIVGLSRAKGGTVLLDGEDIGHLSPRDRMFRGLAAVPPDRLSQGLLTGFSVEENLILGRHGQKSFRRGLLMSRSAIGRFAADLITDYDIQTSGPQQAAGQLSGGNLQKLILARELSGAVKCLVANSPTRGLDVGATEFVHNRLMSLRAAGTGVLLISEDLDEILEVSDRIAVIFDGMITGVSDADQTSKEQVGLLMAGVREVAP